MERENTSGKANLGTFYGVFLPCLLTILGVILFVRLGWVAGNLGLFETWLLISVATSITLITGLSVATIATNMKVGGGGSYYMISRSLGLEAGAAIGLPLFVGKALGVAFYIVGFAESLRIYFPEISIPIIGTVGLLALTSLALISAETAARSQLLVFVMIVASLIGLALGGVPEEGFVQTVSSPEPVTFWVAFAIFFPAVTGIEAGVGLSGDLKNPGKALPYGTLGAILTSYVIYMTVAVLMLAWVPVVLLRSDPLIMREVMFHPMLFDIGIWGAALSSALISLLAAPRTLQKLARDSIVPKFLGKGSTTDDTPRVATALTFLIALAGIWLGGLNDIAKALSMFFLTTYGLLNLAAALEAFLDNPSWRPAFRVKWWISLTGAVASFTVMFFLNAAAAVAAFSVGIVIYIWVHKRHLNRRWQDIRISFWQFLFRVLVYRLRDYEADIRNWRPNLLLFAGEPTRHWYLVELAHALSQERGILTMATVVREDESEDHLSLIEQRVAQLCERGHVTALNRVHRSDNLMHGIRDLIKYYGLGPIRPNTVLLGHSYDFRHQQDFTDLIDHTASEGHNVILARENSEVKSDSRRIVIWWSGSMRNLGFMLAIAYLMQHSEIWSGMRIQVNSIVEPNHDFAHYSENLKSLLANSRIQAETSVWRHESDVDVFQEIRRMSSDAEVVLMSMRPPSDYETPESYEAYYHNLIAELPKVPLLIQVLAAEDLPFFDLFK